MPRLSYYRPSDVNEALGIMATNGGLIVAGVVYGFGSVILLAVLPAILIARAIAGPPPKPPPVPSPEPNR